MDSRVKLLYLNPFPSGTRLPLRNDLACRPRFPLHLVLGYDGGIGRLVRWSHLARCHRSCVPGEIQRGDGILSTYCVLSLVCWRIFLVILKSKGEPFCPWPRIRSTGLGNAVGSHQATRDRIGGQLEKKASSAGLSVRSTRSKAHPCTPLLLRLRIAGSAISTCNNNAVPTEGISMLILSIPSPI